MFRVCTTSPTLKLSSQSQEEHKHSTKCSTKCSTRYSTRYSLGHRIACPVLGEPLQSLSLCFPLQFSFWGVGMAPRLRDSPGQQSPLLPSAWRAGAGSISHTVAVLALPELCWKDEGTKCTRQEMTAPLQTALFIPAPGCFSVPPDKSPFPLRIMGCIFVCFLTLIALPPCIKLSQSS